MEPIHSISIPTTEKTSSYTLYHIQVKLCDARILSLSKRFSDFYAFNQLLLEQIKLLENTPSSIDAPPVALPPKDIGVLWKSNNTAFIESRRLGLENYLTALLYSKDYRWRRTPAWLEFLSVPKDLQSQSRNDNAVFALVPSVSPSKQIIINYENWLTEYSKAQEWVREIRKCIRERDRLVGANSGQAVAAR
jgi:regulator of vacuolar morphogenesis